MDQFLASVELQRHPELVGLPVIVGGNGDPTEPRKVVTCASYEAREFGVHAGMPLRAAARRCPDATFLPSDSEAYDAASDRVMGLLRDLGHPVEVWGWDEAYIGADVDDTTTQRTGRADPTGRRRRDRPVVLGGDQRQQTTRQGRHRVRQACGNLTRSPTTTGCRRWATAASTLCGASAQKPRKSLRHGNHDSCRSGLDRCHGADLGIRPHHGAVDPAAGQGRRRHHGQRRAVGAAVTQPRRHIPARPDRSRRDGLRGRRSRAANAGRDRRIAGPSRHPRRGDGAHQHLLHPHQDPQTAVADHRGRRHRRHRAGGSRPLRAGSAGPAARRTPGTGDDRRAGPVVTTGS